MIHWTRDDITSAQTAGSRFWDCTIMINIHHQLVGCMVVAGSSLYVKI
jgi:hypothetical protein